MIFIHCGHEESGNSENIVVIVIHDTKMSHAIVNVFNGMRFGSLEKRMPIIVTPPTSAANGKSYANPQLSL